MSKSASSRGSFSSLKKAWRKANPSDANGEYVCWICKKPVQSSHVTIDHVLPVSEYPEYKKNMSNLKPAHAFCNEQRTMPHRAKWLTRWGPAKRRKKVFKTYSR